MWCPQCGYEYVEGIDRCADCSSPLVDYNPKSPVSIDPLTYYGTLLLCAIAPWLWYVCSAVISNPFLDRGNIAVALLLSLSIPSVVVFGGAFALGLKRTQSVELLSWVGYAFWLAVLQVLFAVVLVLGHQVPKPYKLVVFTPLTVIFSWGVLCTVALAQVIRHRRVKSRVS